MMWFSLQQLVGVSWTGWPIVCGCSDVEWGEWHAQTVRAMEGLGNANNATRGFGGVLVCLVRVPMKPRGGGGYGGWGDDSSKSQTCWWVGLQLVEPMNPIGKGQGEQHGPCFGYCSWAVTTAVDTGTRGLLHVGQHPWLVGWLVGGLPLL